MMESLGMGFCGGCLANVPVFRNPYGPIAKCLRCLEFDRSRSAWASKNIEMYRNTKQLEYKRGRYGKSRRG